MTYYYNWAPATLKQAGAIYEWGGPLIEVGTGRELCKATTKPAFWAALVQLPDGYDTTPRPKLPTLNIAAALDAARTAVAA